ncbi:MAG: formate dehydrogenase beta subunit [Clostridia bacterium]|nr:formate dehydrogenase beta subunit [Clostridia bacterium]
MGELFFNSWRKEDLPAVYGLQHQEEVKALVGWGGIALKDPGVNIVELLRAYMAMVQEESCGRCIPCRVGSKIILDILTKITQGQGREEDLDLIERIAGLAKDGSLCELGQSFPIPLLDGLKFHREVFLHAITHKQPLGSKGYRYHKLYTAPCMQGCPAHIDIPRYIENIRRGDFEAALAAIREKTVLAGVLGRVCVHPCEANCRRNNLDAPLSIRCLKRFVADFELALRRKPSWPERKLRDKVAIIGSGPAGLSCAYQLARQGYRVTVFEALPVAGGMLAVGIPSYRLPRDILQYEINLLLDLGVEIKLNTRIGHDLQFEDLKKQGFKAIFIATGLHASAKMGLEGEDEGYEGFIPGVDFLREANLGRKIKLGRRVAVVGGGNVAMDCSRVALRLGAEEVYIIYRRSRAEMPAHEAEIEEAEAEGVKYHFLTNPTRIIAKNGKMVGVECIRMELGEPDSSGRRRPVPVPGSEFILEIDNLIPAIGQVSDLDFLPQGEGAINVSRRGTIEVDPWTLATNLPGVFAGGDVVHGARTVIEAVASGNRAAKSIDLYLREGRVAPDTEDDRQAYLDRLGCYDPQEKPGVIAGRSRQQPELLPTAQRKGNFQEVELAFPTPVALKEADRCLRCYRLALAVT